MKYVVFGCPVYVGREDGACSDYLPIISVEALGDNGCKAFAR
jgi:hypothetical protein